jgi:hypothetical protein
LESEKPRLGYQRDRQRVPVAAAAQRTSCSFPGTSPPHPLFTLHVALFFPSLPFSCQMAALEQPADLGARSDTLEEVRCSQSGRNVPLKSSCALQIFRRVEEESERRARVEEMAGVAARATSPPLGIIPIFQHPEDGEDTTASALAKARRRGSLSISRFGQVPCNQLPLTLVFKNHTL